MKEGLCIHSHVGWFGRQLRVLVGLAIVWLSGGLANNEKSVAFGDGSWFVTRLFPSWTLTLGPGFPMCLPNCQTVVEISINFSRLHFSQGSGGVVRAKIRPLLEETLR